MRGRNSENGFHDILPRIGSRPSSTARRASWRNSSSRPGASCRSTASLRADRLPPPGPAWPRHRRRDPRGRAGGQLVHPLGRRASGQALEDALALEMFSPPREDYLKYLNPADVE